MKSRRTPYPRDTRGDMLMWRTSQDTPQLADAVFCYLGRFPKFLDCTSGYQKGHDQQLTMGSKSFLLDDLGDTHQLALQWSG